MKSKNKVIGIILVAIIGITILFFTNVNLAANTAKINVETANLRETADENSRILKQLSLNDSVEILGEEGNWYKVKESKITGYLRKDLLEVEGQENTTSNETTSNGTAENTTSENSADAEIANTTETSEPTGEQLVTEDTNLKIVPSINATNIAEVKKDQKVSVIETINSWVCVETDTTRGWIPREKLISQEEKTAQEQKQKEEEAQKQAEAQKPIKTAYINSTARVNLRKEANTSSEVVAKLTQNTSVEVYSEENGWSKIKVNGQEGYVSSDLLSDKKVETNTTSRGATSIRESSASTSSKTSSSSTSTNKSTTSNTSAESTTTVSSGKGATVVETAKKYLGCKYVYGASGPNSFDCSGFTSYVFKLHGVSLSRTAKGQYSNGTAVSRANLQPGDLVMFGPSASKINHVGIYIGGGKIIHAENPSTGVTTSTINSGYYNNNYVGARRVM